MRFAAVVWIAALVVTLAAASVDPTGASGERSLGVASGGGYTFDTGPVKLVYGANADYWVIARAQGTYCGSRPLGDPWRVWGSYVQYISGEPHLNPIPADGTATFDADGKQVARSLRFPWFVQEMSLRLSESMPKASVWFWNGQSVSRQEVVVRLEPNAECALTLAVKTLACTPTPGIAGKRLAARAVVAVTRGGKPAVLAPTAKVSWRATVGSAALKPQSTTRSGGVLSASWRLPKPVKAKVARITVTVAMEGVTASRTHLHRLR